MTPEYRQGKIDYLTHRISIIEQRLIKSDGANMNSLNEARNQFTEMLRDYKGKRK
jgi:hypothetical protein